MALALIVARNCDSSAGIDTDEKSQSAPVTSRSRPFTASLNFALIAFESASSMIGFFVLRSTAPGLPLLANQSRPNRIAAQPTSVVVANARIGDSPFTLPGSGNAGMCRIAPGSTIRPLTVNSGRITASSSTTSQSAGFSHSTTSGQPSAPMPVTTP